MYIYIVHIFSIHFKLFCNIFKIKQRELNFNIKPSLAFNYKIAVVKDATPINDNIQTKTKIDTETIPIIKPAFAIFFAPLFEPIIPNIIANIAHGIAIYQTQKNTNETIPKTIDAILNPLLSG